MKRGKTVPKLKIRILKMLPYFQDTREIAIGDIYEVEKVGTAERENNIVNCYLFTSKNGKASLAYEDEVELINE